MAESTPTETNRYKILIEKIFFDHWKKGIAEFEFIRDEIKEKAGALKIELPDNIGDIPYSFRYRVALPQSIVDTQPRIGMDHRGRRTVAVPLPAGAGNAHQASRGHG